MSNNATNADNQQGSSNIYHWNPSETIRRAPLSQETIKAYLLGALHDGTFSCNRRFRISQKGTEWLKILQRLFKIVDCNSWIYKEGSDRDVYVVETLASFLDFDFNPLNLKTIDEGKAYIRGFFDAEGGIPHDSSARFYIQLVQKDLSKLEKIKKILNKSQIKCGKIHNPSVRVDPDLWRMYILTDFHQEFIKQIGSWHPRKIKILRERMKI